MRYLMIIGCIILATGLSSCSIYFEAYLRNLSNQTALVDVVLLKRSKMPTLPNEVTVANRALRFKAGFRKYLDSSQHVNWIDPDHFNMQVKPNTSIDLADMMGKFLNSHPLGDVRVIVTSGKGSDTLQNGRSDFRHDKFEYTKVGVYSPILYYDIKE